MEHPQARWRYINKTIARDSTADVRGEVQLKSVFQRLEDKIRSHLGDLRLDQQSFVNEIREALQVSDPNVQHVIRISGYGECRLHLRLPLGPAGELLVGILPMHPQIHADYCTDGEAELPCAQSRLIALDDTGRLKRSTSTRTLRRRQVDEFGKLRIRQGAIALQGLQDLVVKLVQKVASS